MQNKWIDIVNDFNVKGKPLLFCNHFEIEKKVHMGSWRPMSSANFPVDYRAVLVNEIVWDIDFKEWNLVKTYANKIILQLQMNDIPYILGMSGGKGVHIHVFFDASIEEHMKERFENAMKIGFQIRDVRAGLWTQIMTMAGIDPILFSGKMKKIDPTVVRWNDNTKGHLIREFGGRKHIGSDEEGSPKYAYKTYIQTVPERRDLCRKKDKIVYPERIETWKVPNALVYRILERYIEKHSDESTRETLTLKNKKYTQLECVQNLITQGNEEGMRHEGAGVIAVACALDKLPRNDAIRLLEQYRKSSLKYGGEPFSSEELEKWIEWIQERGGAFWDDRTCSLMGKFGTSCKSCRLKEVLYKDATTFLYKKDLLKEIDKELSKVIVGERENRLLLFMMYCSAYMGDRIHPRATGESSSGKSYLLNQVLKFFPDDDVIKLTYVSPKAFNYAFAEIGDIDGKIILVQEFEGAEDAVVTLRPLMSGDQKGLSISSVERDEDGKLASRKIEVKGMPVFASASTKVTLDPEFETRTWVFEPDNSPEQTSSVMQFEAEEDVDPGCHRPERIDLIKQCIQLLKSQKLTVLNPYATVLARKIKPTSVRYRRDFKKIKTFIKISAWLHQFSRPKVHRGNKEYILAVLEDYEMVKNLLSPSFNMIFSFGSSDVRQCYDTCKKLADTASTITSKTVAAYLKWSTKRAAKSLKELDNRGFLFKEIDSADKRMYAYHIRDKSMDTLPTLDRKELLEESSKTRSIISDALLMAAGREKATEDSGL